MEAKTVEVLKPKTIEETYTAAEAAAKKYKDGQVLEKGVTGYTVYSYKCKYDKTTDKLISREYEATSNYVKKDQIVVKVIDVDPVTGQLKLSLKAVQPPRKSHMRYRNLNSINRFIGFRTLKEKLPEWIREETEE